MDKRGLSRLSVGVFLYHNATKLSQGNPIVLRSRKIPAAKKIMD